jgi:hypothetical protein
MGERRVCGGEEVARSSFYKWVQVRHVSRSAKRWLDKGIAPRAELQEAREETYLCDGGGGGGDSLGRLADVEKVHASGL